MNLLPLDWIGYPPVFAIVTVATQISTILLWKFGFAAMKVALNAASIDIIHKCKIRFAQDISTHIRR